MTIYGIHLCHIDNNRMTIVMKNVLSTFFRFYDQLRHTFYKLSSTFESKRDPPRVPFLSKRLSRNHAKRNFP
jgi:hypothetical protein